MPLAAAGVTGTGKLERRAEVELERDGDRTVDGTNAPLSAARWGQAPQPRSGAPEAPGCVLGMPSSLGVKVPCAT